MTYPRVKVRSLVHMLGLEPQQEAEIDLTPKVHELLLAGYFQMLRPRNGTNVSQ